MEKSIDIIQELCNRLETQKKEFNAALKAGYEEAYREVCEEKRLSEVGYKEAYEIIADLRARLDLQKKDFEEQLDKITKDNGAR